MKRVHLKILRSGMVATVIFCLSAVSCIKDISMPGDSVKGGTGEASVTFSLQLPANATPGTRALKEEHENLIETIDVLAFKANGDYAYTTYGIIGATSVTVNLIKSADINDKYDLVFLANMRSEVMSHDFTTTPTKTKVLEALTKTVTGKWNANPAPNPAPDSDPYMHLPMSSNPNETKLKGLEIKEGMNNGNNIEVALHRALARVNVELKASPVPVDKSFKLMSVHVYNYNKVGAVVPYKSDWGKHINTEEYPGQNNFRVVKPTVPTQTTQKGPLLYTGGEVIDWTSCKNEIYIFEVDNHNSGAAKPLTERCCIVIGGIYDATGNGVFTGSNPTDFYRIDFADASQDYLDILRNHSYNITVTAINGPGFLTPDEAFKSLPVNITADVIAWNDENGDIIVYGEYYLSKDRAEIHFDQFGEPVYGLDSNVIRLGTNSGNKITISGSNITVGGVPLSGGEEALTHGKKYVVDDIFTVDVEKKKEGDEDVYTLTVTASAAVSPDNVKISREVVITVKDVIETTLTFIRDFYPDALETRPVNGTITSVDHASNSTNRFLVEVYSKSDYTVTSTENWVTVWPERSGGTKYTNGAIIDKTVQKVWVQFDALPSGVVRSGELVFVSKTGITSKIKFTQGNFYLTAKRIGEGEISGFGGTATFEVETNASGWTASVTDGFENVYSPPSEDEPSMVFRPNTSLSSTKREITVTFKAVDESGVDVPDVPITVIQLPASIPEAPLASPGVIGYIYNPGYPNHHTLTLNGSKEYKGTVIEKNSPTGELCENYTVYVAYFRWGSLIALSSEGGDGDEFDSGDVIWGPPGYDLDQLKSDIDGAGSDINKVPPTENLPSFTNNPSAGLGDPCVEYFGTPGSWRMPTMRTIPTLSWHGGVDDGPFGSMEVMWIYNSLDNGARFYRTDPNPENDYYSKDTAAAGIPIPGAVAGGGGQEDWSMFLPAAGFRMSGKGNIGSQGVDGFYWTTTMAKPSDNDYNYYCMSFTQQRVSPGVVGTKTRYRNGYAVRCVKQP